MEISQTLSQMLRCSVTDCYPTCAFEAYTLDPAPCRCRVRPLDGQGDRSERTIDRGNDGEQCEMGDRAFLRQWGEPAAN